MGRRMAVLAHHYQQDEVVQHADVIGDSLELARKIPELDAEYIVMCGVYFMAESAAILAKEGQKVLSPDREAGCTLSELAPGGLLEMALQGLKQEGRTIVPLAYVNTSASVKALCGRYGGTVCTSANAATMLDWALKQGDGVLFLPDKNLAHNVADELGLPEDRRSTFSQAGSGQDIRLYIWPGLCDVHLNFQPEQIEAVRKENPSAKVIVHPECPPEVVRLADASGSTSKIIAFVDRADPGSVIFVGTEINLVNRLAARYAGSKTIRPLTSSACLHMAKITEAKLCSLVEDIASAEPVTVDADTRSWALKALERMLEVCS
jgi:quinolinate synthase